MIKCSSFSGKTVAVFGLGGSGLATCEALRLGGATVIAYDDGQAGREKAQAAGFEVRDLRELAWREISALVLSPGVPLTHPAPHWAVVLAQQNHVEIIGDLELFARELKNSEVNAPLIAITGTNGKSTTTALITHILFKLGVNAQMGGNIGKAALTLEPPKANTIYVLECSSFQIDLAPSLKADVAILTNITPDHIDRHGSLENYAAIKYRLVQKAKQSVVGIKGEVQGTLEYHVEAETTQGINALRGAHNAQNAALALIALQGLGYEKSKILEAMRSFGGLEHRMEEVGRKGKVLFINDSKATNADSTDKALSSFERVYWIAGGVEKEGGIESLRSFFPSIAKTYLIGKASKAFAHSLQGFAFEECETLEKAVQRASQDAALDTHHEPVVLLSPACASYDQYKNFEERGEAFKTLVAKLL